MVSDRLTRTVPSRWLVVAMVLKETNQSIGRSGSAVAIDDRSEVEVAYLHR